VTGIFCIETDWWGDYNRTTVKPLLELVGNGMVPTVEYVHRDVATREELAHHLRRWRRTRRFPVLFLVCHGAPGLLYLDHRQRRSDAVSLDELGQMIGPGCSGRIVHFGACSTLGIDIRRITRFLRHTGVTAVTGFQKDVDFLRSATFELLLLAAVLRYRVTRRGARRMEQVLRTEVPSLRRELAFRMVINGS
jgi:hypothetical protein